MQSLCMLWYQDGKDRNATCWLSRACLTDRFTFKKLFFYAKLSRLSLGSRLDQIYWAGKDSRALFYCSRRKQKEHISQKKKSSRVDFSSLAKAAPAILLCIFVLFTTITRRYRRYRNLTSSFVYVYNPRSNCNFLLMLARLQSCP